MIQCLYDNNTYWFSLGLFVLCAVCSWIIERCVGWRNKGCGPAVESLWESICLWQDNSWHVVAGTLFYQEVKLYDGSKSCVCVCRQHCKPAVGCGREERHCVYRTTLLSRHFPGGRDLFAVGAAASVGLQLGPSGGRPVRDRARRLNGMLG